jgi:pteridine reductase
MLLAGKSALVTGAANRIGAQIARTLHQNGANLIIHYRNSLTGAQALEQELNAERTGSAVCYQADLSDIEAIESLAQKAAQAFDRLDILVNNASSFYPTRLGEISERDWQELIGSNLKAPLFLSQACYPNLRETDGAIVNMLDIYASLPLKNHSLYCCAKAANQMLVKSLALEMAPQVRVNGIAPGAILWPESSDASDPEKQQELLRKIPLQRTGSPDAIAQTVLFLLGHDYITGEVIRVDGGRLLSSI